MNDLNGLFRRYGPYFAFIVALTATAGSLYYSEVRHFTPCTLCWYQRILMYPLVLIILVAIVERDKLLANFVLPFSVIGAFVSTYHYLVEWEVFGSPTSCEATIPCSYRWVNYFGFISIPFMALVAFLMITVIMIVTKRAYNQAIDSFAS